MTNTSEQSDSLNDRVESLEIDMVDVKSALNQLIDYSVQNNQRMTDAIDRLAQVQTNTLQLVERLQTQVTEMQAEVRGLQTENRRIWEIISDRLGLE
jgi:septation ring formation regulator EzrA